MNEKDMRHLSDSSELAMKTRSNHAKVKRPFSLPWWFKIIGYILAFTFAAVSIFFIIMQGITFGNEKSGKWLTALIMSFFASIFIIQPLQVKRKDFISLK